MSDQNAGRDGLIADRSPFPFRAFLTDVRVRAANDITEYICAFDKDADPADVHEDVREALSPFFKEIQEKVQGPECQEVVWFSANTGAKCDLVEGHEGDCHPCTDREGRS